MEAPLREVKSKFSRYGEQAHQGQRITVTKHGKPWFDLVPHQSRKRNLKPLRGAKPMISEEEATAPVDAPDIEGWT